MSKSKSEASGGLSFASVLTLIFITLKLTGYIAWSWWWVLAPLWIPIAVLLAFIVCCAIALGAIALWDCLKGKT